MKTLRGDRCRCSGCGEHFNSTFAFDKHRNWKDRKAPRCLTAAEMESKGFVRNEAGFWITAQRVRGELQEPVSVEVG